MSTQVVESEVAGTVWKIEVTAGSTVQADDVLMILESMKMEIPAQAPCDGTVAEILVSEGDPVSEGQALARISPAQ